MVFLECRAFSIRHGFPVRERDPRRQGNGSGGLGSLLFSSRREQAAFRNEIDNDHPMRGVRSGGSRNYLMWCLQLAAGLLRSKELTDRDLERPRKVRFDDDCVRK